MATEHIGHEEFMKRMANAYDSDVVKAPAHYKTGDIECIDAIKAALGKEAFKGYLTGNCLKYLWRYPHKGKPKQDLLKTRQYLDWLIDEVPDG